MALSSNLKEKMARANQGDDQLLNAFIDLWVESPGIPKDQFLSALNELQTLCKPGVRSDAWISISKAIYYSLWAGTGNAFEKLNEALELFRRCNDEAGEGLTLAFSSLYYKNIGQLDKAQECVNNAINKLKEHDKYLYFFGVAHFQGAEINQLLKDYDAALDYLTKGLVYFENDTGTFKSRLLNAVGNIHKSKNDLSLALDYFERSLKHIEGKNNHVLESKNYSDIGNYYLRVNNFEKSMEYQLKSIDIRERMNQTRPLISNYLELAELYLKQDLPEKALEKALRAESLANEHNVMSQVYQTCFTISNIYEALGEHALALSYYKKYHSTKDQITGQENARKIKQINMHHEMETMQKEKEIFELRNIVLKEALDDINASVRYAKRIQEAILSPLELIRSKFNDAFVLYKPKDIVAGDFYWMEEINDLVFLAAADCTGHGVPGAMVSVVCSNALNRAVKEFRLTEPGAILDKVTSLVLETFEKSVSDVKDGMDISLMSFNRSTRQIQWSGANNPLWYFESSELREIPADKQPVGKSDNRKPFTTHIIPYVPNTMFYLFTDGFADQFGGPHGKKYKYKPLKEKMQAIQSLPAQQQHTALNNAFEEWRGELEQVDDVCIIGFKI